MSSAAAREAGNLRDAIRTAVLTDNPAETDWRYSGPKSVDGARRCAYGASRWFTSERKGFAQLESFHDSLPMRLYRALNSDADVRQVFSEFGLTEQQWRVLRVLWERGSVPLSCLASATLIPAPSLVGVVDGARGGLVARERSTGDRRVVYIYATEQGQSLEASVRPRVDAVYAQLMDQIEPKCGAN